MTPTAADVMSPTVVAADPEMTLEELAGLFAENRIHGAPVLDAHGRPVGVVTVTDLLRRMRDEVQAAGQEPGTWYRRGDNYAEILPPDAAWITEMPDARVRDIMRREVIAVDAAEPIVEVARKMRDADIHRVLVTRGPRIVGIVSSMDIVRAVAQGWPPSG